MEYSKDELLADLQEFGKVESRPPKVAQPTEKGYASILRLWTNFTDRLEQPGLLPTTQSIKTFFKMITREREGILRERLSLQTLDAYLTRLVAAYKRAYGFEIEPCIAAEVRGWISKDLKDMFELSSKARQKPLMSTQDLDVLIHYLWAEDQHVYKSEHFRIQLAFYLLIHAYTACRPGAVIVSDSYRNSNESITFRDLKFYLSRDKQGGPPNMSLSITFNLMKGHRDQEAEFITITLWEDRIYPHLCPIILFLSLAFHYRAFDLEPDQLFCHVLDRDVVVVNFRDSVLDTPLFRSYNRTTAWTYAGCYKALTALAFRAGYRCQVTSYCIRRGAANALDKSTSWAQKGLILGHKNPKTLQDKYISRHLDTCVQDLFHDRPMDTDHTRQLHELRSLAMEHFPGAPHSLQGTRLYMELNQDPEYLECRQKWKELKEVSVDRTLIGLARRKMDNKLRNLRLHETKKYREEWIKANSSRSLTNPTYQEPTKENYVPPPRLAKVIELLYPAVTSPTKRLDLLHSLLAMFTARNVPTKVSQSKRKQDSPEKRPYSLSSALDSTSRVKSSKRVCGNYQHYNPEEASPAIVIARAVYNIETGKEE